MSAQQPGVFAQTMIRAASCRICGYDCIVSINPSATIMERAKLELAEHVEKHTREQIVRVYVLHEPWWKVFNETEGEAKT